MSNKKILAFGASNSKNSINKKLATYATTLLKNSDFTFIDLNDYEMPLFSVDREKDEGIPQLAYDFRSLVESHDGIIISFAEHNGAYTVAFKNIFDWISRIDGSTWGDTPILLLGTSPGGRGASSVLEMASKRLPFNGGFVHDTFSLPFFVKNFETGIGITNEEKLEEMIRKLDAFEKSLRK